MNTKVERNHWDFFFKKIVRLENNCRKTKIDKVLKVVYFH